MATAPAGAGPGTSSLASFLPGQVPDRETWEGWTRCRLARGTFTPAPVVTAAGHTAMTARQRRLHDLHRAATHSNLRIQATPTIHWVSREVGDLVALHA